MWSRFKKGSGKQSSEHGIGGVGIQYFSFISRAVMNTRKITSLSGSAFAILPRRLPSVAVG